MAIFMCQITPINRAAGQSSVASAAYRAGMAITDRRLERTFDFTRRGGVEHTEIMLPPDAPERFADRSTLWNEVELAERRKDARPARELLLALPHELDFEQRRALVRDFVGETLVARGMIADVAMHAPGREGDHRNHHAHILITTRQVGPEGLGLKGREWDSPQAVREFRSAWEQVQNRHLERALGVEFKPVSAKSLREQGIDREPTVHLGPRATDMERRGLRSERGDVNREVRHGRERLLEARRERNALEDRLAEADPKRELHVTTVQEQFVSLRGMMVDEVKSWRREMEAIERPRVVTEAAVRRELLTPLQREAERAKRALAQEKTRAIGDGLDPREIARLTKNPARAIWQAHAHLDRIAKAQKELRIAERANQLQDRWLGSEAGTSYVKARVDPSREQAAESLTKRRTLERKIRRGEARIRNLDLTRGKLDKAREVGVGVVLAPERVKYGRDQMVREIDRNIVAAFNKQLSLDRGLSLDKGGPTLARIIKRALPLPPLG